MDLQEIVRAVGSGDTEHSFSNQIAAFDAASDQITAFHGCHVDKIY